MTHTSGFPAEFQFFKKKGECYSQNREKTIGLLDNVPLSYGVEEKQVYSDIGFMIAGAVVEAITNQSLDSYVEENIYKPLGIETVITYEPLKHNIDQQDIACTECMGNTRGGSIYFRGYSDLYAARGSA